MKKFLLAICLLYTVKLQAQLVIKSGVSKEELVSAFAGGGLAVSNITLSGTSNAYGTFTNGNSTNIGMDKGVLLTTGSTSTAIGPNGSGSSGYCNGTSGGDPALLAIAPSATEDAMVLEFDMVPQCNQVTVSFVFGSEEYPEFVNASYNDAFGLFLSGPGPACQAGYYNNTNIATLPDNVTPVSIDNVNAGKNASYYVNNTGGATIQYDGFTKKISRTLTVCPCQTYHFKISIADAGDCYYDSGVFVDLLQCNAPLTATVTSTPACGSNNGTATVTTTGIGPFTYSWSPTPGGGQGSATATGLTPGTAYTVTVNDGLACSPAVTQTVTIGGISVASSSQVNPTCFSSNDGTATVNINGTASSYSWSPSGGTNATGTNLAKGSYTVTVKDVNNCTVTQNFTLTAPDSIAATRSQNDVSCNGGTNGSATVNVSGGTAGYTYSWSPLGGTGATASNLSAGNYTVTIKDSKNCSLTKKFSIVEPAVLTATQSHTDVSCNGGNNGSATVVASGGNTGGYLYSWSPSGGTAATANNLAAGNYTITIKDSKNCSVTKNFTIAEPVALTATQSHTDVSCNGENNGSATVVTSGGNTGGYLYSWSPSGGTAATANNLAAGNYTITIKDSKNCSVTKNFTIAEPVALTATQSHTDVSCNGGNNGSATVVTSGGNTGGYLYSWSPSGGTAATANNLAAGNYTVTIKDSKNCSITKNFTIAEPVAITKNQTLSICHNSYAMVGNNKYTDAGTYTDVLTAGNGCDSTVYTTITIKSPVDATVSQNGNILEAQLAGAVYQWLDCNDNFAAINTANGQSFSPSVNGSYAVRVSENTCADTSSCQVFVLTSVNPEEKIEEKVLVYPNPTLGIFTITGLKENSVVSIFDVQGTLVNTISQSEKSLSIDISNEVNGIYIIKVSNAQSVQTFKLNKQ